MIKRIKIGLLVAGFFCFLNTTHSQHSVARQWNEMVLESIRADFARPTVHARNLFHTSTAMYDAWAIYTEDADTYFLGKTVSGYSFPKVIFPKPDDIRAAQEEAISYAVYRLIRHRFENAPRVEELFEDVDQLMLDLGYDINNTSLDFGCSAAGMGNFIADQIIKFGYQDGSNEINDYENIAYEPVNLPLIMNNPGNPDISDLNRWQPLQLSQFIDQSGTIITNNIPDFLSPEWGQVVPFSLQEEDLTIFERDNFDYYVYHDPGAPPYIDINNPGGMSEEFKWGHALVSVWSAHLDPNDGVLWDISPASIGNIQSYPEDILGLRDFYNLEDGGDPGMGHSYNPKTDLPYDPNIVPRADYARVLAEFWADGPDSETPPGHWFTILNYVNDHPDLEKRFKGEGDVLDDLEWDVKSYFILGGTMHDVAISAWGIKGWYDYVRPVSAIRGMAELGQSSDPDLPSYHPGGIPLIPGFIELIGELDSLKGTNGQFIGEIKLKAWRGPDYIEFPQAEYAGVDWIRAAEWWPYQRPSFVTPPFAGYVSGHSTYSRAAAEVLTALTGDPFFPGGMGEFVCKRNEFLVFEDGPSVDVTLQWATYRDASDQCSLSRIWGGIHPPCDDIPGRLIGEEIGQEAFVYAETYFSKEVSPVIVDAFKVYPNPTSCLLNIEIEYEGSMPIQVFYNNGQKIIDTELQFVDNRAFLNLGHRTNGIYVVIGYDAEGERIFEEKVLVN